MFIGYLLFNLFNAIVVYIIYVVWNKKIKYFLLRKLAKQQEHVKINKKRG